MQYEIYLFFFFQAEDGIRDVAVTGVQTCALPIWLYSLTLVLGNTGLINRTLQAIGVIGHDDFVPLIRNQVSVVIGLVYFVLPFVVFTLAGALRRLDVALQEAAQNLGADDVRPFSL